MRRIQLIFLHICIAIWVLKVGQTTAGNEAAAARKDNNTDTYGVSKIGCYAKRKGTKGPGNKYDADVTVTCCKKPYADCRRLNVMQSGNNYYCLVNSKENEEEMKTCCKSMERETKFGTLAYTGESEKAERNGTAFKKMKTCDSWAL